MEAGIAYGWSKLITSHSSEFDKGLIPKPFIGLNSILVTDLEKVRSALDALKVKPTDGMEKALEIWINMTLEYGKTLKLGRSSARARACLSGPTQPLL